MRRMLLALQFLTVIPVKLHGEITERDVAGSAVYFPLVGALQGLLTALAAMLLMRVFPADVTAGLSLAILILSNGGFDLDGLADTVDALSVKSSGHAEADRARRLSVMKDSAVGAMGVMALIVILLLKYLLMHRLLADMPLRAATAIFLLMPAVSRWITVPVMYHATAARKDGLGRLFVEHTGAGSVVISSTITVCLFLLMAVLPDTGASWAGGIGFGIVSMGAFYVMGILAFMFLRGKFGGITGDHFGALTEVAEVLFLMAGYVWLRHSIS